MLHVSHIADIAHAFNTCSFYDREVTPWRHKHVVHMPQSYPHKDEWLVDSLTRINNVKRVFLLWRHHGAFVMLGAAIYGWTTGHPSIAEQCLAKTNKEENREKTHQRNIIIYFNKHGTHERRHEFSVPFNPTDSVRQHFKQVLNSFVVWKEIHL